MNQVWREALPEISSRENILYDKLRAALKLRYDAKLAMIGAEPDEMPEKYEEYKTSIQNVNKSITDLSVQVGQMVSVDDSGVIFIGDRDR